MTAFLRDRRVLLGLALLLVLYLAAIPSRPEPRFADECGYWFAAQSLRERGTLQLLHVQGEPPAVFYPPGTSALIAVLSFPSTGRPLMAFVAWSLAGLLALAASAVLLARRMPAPHALLICGLVGLTAVHFDHAHALLSDIPFAAVLAVLLALIEAPGARGTGATVLAAVLAVLAMSLRSAAVGPLAGLLVYLAVRRWRAARGGGADDAPLVPALAAVAGFVAAAAAWGIAVRLCCGGRLPGYLDFFWKPRDLENLDLTVLTLLDLPMRALRNGWDYSSALSLLVCPVLREPVLPLQPIPAILVAAGWIDSIRARFRPSDGVALVMGGMLLLWPSCQFRFLLPLLPLVIAYAARGAVVLFTRCPRAWRVGALGAWLAVSGAWAVWDVAAAGARTTLEALRQGMGLAVCAAAAAGWAVAEARAAAERPAGPWWGRRLPAAALFVVAVLNLASLGLVAYRIHTGGSLNPGSQDDAAARDYRAVARWARDGLPAGAAVLCREPGLFYWHARRPAWPVPVSRRPEALLAVAEARAIPLVLFDAMRGHSREDLAKALDLPGIRWTVLRREGTAVLARWERAGDAGR